MEKEWRVSKVGVGEGGDVLSTRKIQWQTGDRGMVYPMIFDRKDGSWMFR